jgi:HEPN domain-containing protein
MAYYGLQIVERHPDPFFRQFAAARSYYIMARVAIVEGYCEPGILLAEQAIEIYIKAIRRKLGREDVLYGHSLPGLLEATPAPRPSYFDLLLTDPDKRAFLDGLTTAYAPVRYGEVAYGLGFGPMLAMLDEITHNLDRTFRDLEPQAGRRRYVPETLRRLVFIANQHLTEDEVTSNMVAIAGQVD